MEKQELCAEIHKIDLAKSHTYAMLVIAFILLVISMIFLAMSFKFSSTGQQNFAPKSMEFAACYITGGIGVLLLIWGVARWIYQATKQKALKADLEALKQEGK